MGDTKLLAPKVGPVPPPLTCCQLAWEVVKTYKQLCTHLIVKGSEDMQASGRYAKEDWVHLLKRFNPIRNPLLKKEQRWSALKWQVLGGCVCGGSKADAGSEGHTANVGPLEGAWELTRRCWQLWGAAGQGCNRQWLQVPRILTLVLPSLQGSLETTNDWGLRRGLWHRKESMS